MFQSSAFDYINVLDKAADASWLRETTLANNIANATTPEYKRYDVDFQSLLERELMDSKFNRNLDKKIHNVNLDHLTATSQIDMAAEPYPYRTDKQHYTGIFAYAYGYRQITGSIGIQQFLERNERICHYFNHLVSVRRV